LCIFLLDTGARHTEVSGIVWDLIDMDRREVDLYRGKGGRASTLAMTERLHAMLVRRRKMTGTRRHVFPAGGGRRGAWSEVDAARGHATKGIQRTIDALGLNASHMVAALGKVTPHTFRDTFASRLIQRGFSLYEVQALLGHASPAMTQKYAKLKVTETSARASAALDKVAGQSYPWKRTPALAATAAGLVIEAKLPVEEDPSADLGPLKIPHGSGPLAHTVTLDA
ncbi:tyrosine-type recombinase/integrase, partial [Piscinibacter sp.]|uniref:tyrosine-type recombinase/integrase n=1 Tax=Piscinibacter sp. TaxID=1903157 RepID=UPI002D05AA77